MGPIKKNSMNYNMMGVYNFSIMQGIGHVEVFSKWIINNVPLNLSQADDIRVDFKRESQSKVIALSLNISNGGLIVNDNKLEFHFGHNTLDLEKGIYLYDILIILNGERHNYVRGEMTVYPMITK